ncbi:MAG: ABC transporter permease, partial [Candidatus Lindowbacteria bacterium]|nr:ABC transporter permease [Candidatus Lindowbacteria bacterium]
MDRYSYFLKRLLLVIPTLIGISIICFTLTQFVPGGPVEQALMQMRGMNAGGDAQSGGMSTETITEAHRKEIEKHFGFDKPVYERYWIWVKKVVVLDFGDSYKYPSKTSWQLIKERFSVSLIFGITGFLLTYAICIPLGIQKALRHGSAFDATSSVIVFAGYAIPPFAFGMLLKMFLSGTTDGLFDWFPVTGFVIAATTYAITIITNSFLVCLIVTSIV